MDVYMRASISAIHLVHMAIMRMKDDGKEKHSNARKWDCKLWNNYIYVHIVRDIL